MPARKTADAMVLEFLIEAGIGLADSLIEDVAKGRHGEPLGYSSARRRRELKVSRFQGFKVSRLQGCKVAETESGDDGTPLLHFETLKPRNFETRLF
jgi:hypothetical protein